jgi:hypothetical protein
MTPQLLIHSSDRIGIFRQSLNANVQLAIVGSDLPQADRRSEEASDRSALGSYSRRSLALLKQLRVDSMNSLEESDMKGYLREGFMGEALPILKIPKHRLLISVNYRIMSSYRSYTGRVG